MTAITTGLFVLAAGASLALAALLTCSRGLSWFGRLPGDIRHRGARARVYVPVTSTLLLSLSLSLLVYLLRLVF